MGLLARITTFLIIFFSLLLNVYLFKTVKQYEEKEKIVIKNVVDGDTLLLQTGERIRLGNIESPELDKCGGVEAKKILENSVKNKSITLDIFAYDVYNRPIALVYADKVLVNEIILKNGWARYDGSPSPKREILKQAYDFAFANKKGIFSPLCMQLKPIDSKCLIKGNIERNTNKKTYQFPGCSEYERIVVERDLGEDWFCNEKEAQTAGYIKAEHCFGKKYIIP